MDDRENSNERDGMVFYLKLSRDIYEALMKRDLPFLQRIEKMWGAFFQLKYWFLWMNSPKNPYPKAMRKEALPSYQLFETIEITANGLCLMIQIMAQVSVGV